MHYYKMSHCGGLAEAVMTAVEISFEEFLNLLPLYKRYAFDERINAFRYILDWKNHGGLEIMKSFPFWLLECQGLLEYRTI